MSGALLVFAKDPRPGEVKTRLSPPFTLEQAAAFYEALLDDVLEASALAATHLGLTPFLCVTPPASVAVLADRAPPPFEALAQRGGGLGERREHAVADVEALGHAPLLLRGSDSPGLTERALRRALDALARGADVVLAPDQGGGYLLVGLRRSAPGLFAHPMSTTSVLGDTLACARRLGLRADLLEAGFDVDTAGDLALLARARASSPEPLPCRRALAFLDAQDLWAKGPEPSR